MNLKAVSRIVVIAIIVIIIAVAGVGTYLYVETTKTRLKETLVIGMNADLNIFDPHKAIGLSNLGIVRLVCETLTDVDQKTFKVKSVLAESWESSEGNTKWTFHLRRGVKFHDGTPFNSEAVKYNFDRLMDPETKAGTRGIWMGTIKSIEIVDDRTLIFHTVPSPAFPAILNYPPAGMISPTQGKKLGLDFYKQPIGTGPWKFVEHIAGDHIKLVANNEYWGGSPKIKEIIAKPIVETASRIMALEAGAVDCIFFVPPHEADRLSKNSKLQVIEGIPSSNCIIQLNCQWGPLKDTKVRQALNYAVDKQAIVSHIFMGKSKVMDSWIPSSVFGYSGKAYEYDPDKARKLLAEAGYPNGFDVTLTYGKGTVMLDTEIVEAVQSYLSAIGVNAKIVEMDFPSFTASMRIGVENNTLQLSLCAWRVGLWMDADKGLENLRSDQWPPKGIVPLFWKNETLDTLHDLGRTEEDSNERLEIYKQIQMIVMEEAPAIFLIFPPNTNAASAKVHGIGLRHDESILLPPDAWVEA
jgi:peptide/nickel transport system substrate-binding protein